MHHNVRLDATYSDLQTFIAHHDFVYPKREAIDTAEGALAKWVNNQRPDYVCGALPQNRVRALEELRHWRWCPYGNVWQQHCSELHDWCDAIGRLPLHNANDDEECAHAPWRNHQRYVYGAGKLATECIDALEKITYFTWDAFASRWTNPRKTFPRYTMPTPPLTARTSHLPSLMTNLQAPLWRTSIQILRQTMPNNSLRTVDQS